ncbi:MAG TPA: hypothetical protein VF209_01455 [Patescibacteria group bacterium]
MDITLQEVFYTLGIIVAILNIIFLGVLAIGAWYVYKAYTTAKDKVVKVTSGMVVMRLVGKLMHLFRGRRRARVI